MLVVGNFALFENSLLESRILQPKTLTQIVFNKRTKVCYNFFIPYIFFINSEVDMKNLGVWYGHCMLKVNS